MSVYIEVNVCVCGLVFMPVYIDDYVSVWTRVHACLH